MLLILIQRAFAGTEREAILLYFDDFQHDMQAGHAALRAAFRPRPVQNLNGFFALNYCHSTVSNQHLVF